MSDAVSGFSVLPHTADVMVEAWGPTLGACVNAAVHGLGQSFARVRASATTRTWESSSAATSEEDALMSVLEDVVFHLDADDVLIVDAELQLHGGELRCRYRAVGIDDLEVVGTPPKAISYHAMELVKIAGLFRCRFLVDI